VYLPTDIERGVRDESMVPIPFLFRDVYVYLPTDIERGERDESMVPIPFLFRDVYVYLPTDIDRDVRGDVEGGREYTMGHRGASLWFLYHSCSGMSMCICRQT